MLLSSKCQNLLKPSFTNLHREQMRAMKTSQQKGWRKTYFEQFTCCSMSHGPRSLTPSDEFQNKVAMAYISHSFSPVLKGAYDAPCRKM